MIKRSTSCQHEPAISVTIRIGITKRNSQRERRAAPQPLPTFDEGRVRFRWLIGTIISIIEPETPITLKVSNLLPSPVGSGPMRYSPRLPATALVWLVTAAMLLQPVVGLDCACDCHETTRTCTVPECDHGQDDGHTHGSCHAQTMLGNEVAQAPRNVSSDPHAMVGCLGECKRPLSPCDCPADCHCRALHEAPITTVIRCSIRVNRDLVVAVHDLPANRGCNFVANPGSRDHSSVWRTINAPYAQATCALFCRFTI